MAQGPRWAGKQQGCAVTRAVDLNDAAGRRRCAARIGGLAPFVRTASDSGPRRTGQLRDSAGRAWCAQSATCGHAGQGALAARQKQPTIIVTALTQDLPYLNQAIWKGTPAQRAVAVHLENLTAGASQPYHVTIKAAQ